MPSFLQDFVSNGRVMMHNHTEWFPPRFPGSVAFDPPAIGHGAWLRRCVSLLVTLFFLPPLSCTPNPGPEADDNPYSGQLVFSGLRSAITSISGRSATEIYAVGSDLGQGDGPNVLTYDGQSWRRLPTGLSAGSFWWISVEPIDGSFYLAGDPGIIVEFNPDQETFEQHQTPGTETMYGVWGVSANDLWAVGGDLATPDTGGVIWHFDGNGWQISDLSAPFPDGFPLLYKVWGRSPAEVYAVGAFCTVLRFDGASWSPIPCDTTRSIFTVHGDAENLFGAGGFADGVIAELIDGVFVNRAPAGFPQMNGVFVPSGGTPVAVGNEASLAIRTPSGWELQNTQLNTFRDFHAAWIDREGGIWAVGGNLSLDLNDGIIAYFGPKTISTTISND